MSTDVRMFKFSEEIPGRRWTRKTVIDGETFYHYVFNNAKAAETKIIQDITRGMYEFRADSRTTTHQKFVRVFAMVRGYFRNRKSTSIKYSGCAGRD